MISNVNDLSVWVELLATGTLLSPETQAARMQVIPMAEGSPVQYGLGIMELFGFYRHNVVSPDTAPSCFTIRTLAPRS